MVELFLELVLRRVELLSEDAQERGQKLDGVILLIVLEERVAPGHDLLDGFGSEGI